MNVTQTFAHTATTTTDDQSIKIFLYVGKIEDKDYTVLLSSEFQTALLQGTVVLENGKTFQSYIESTTNRISQPMYLDNLDLQSEIKDTITSAEDLEKLEQETLTELWEALSVVGLMKKPDKTVAEIVESVEVEVISGEAPTHTNREPREAIPVLTRRHSAPVSSDGSRELDDDLLAPEPSTSDTPPPEQNSNQTHKTDHRGLKMMALGAGAVACFILSHYHNEFFTAVGNYFGLNSQ